MYIPRRTVTVEECGNAGHQLLDLAIPKAHGSDDTAVRRAHATPQPNPALARREPATQRPRKRNDHGPGSYSIRLGPAGLAFGAKGGPSFVSTDEMDTVFGCAAVNLQR
jgi:hypothetical protein